MATTHESLIAQNRAKFSKNRVVYVTPNGLHTAYDISDLGDLKNQLIDAKFEARASSMRDGVVTTDWFKRGDNDFWESYVITEH